MAVSLAKPPLHCINASSLAVDLDMALCGFG